MLPLTASALALTLALPTIPLATQVTTAATERWPSPVGGDLRIERLFALPFGEYRAGHRGIDLDAAEGTPIRAPVAGVVHFADDVVDRGVLTIRVDAHTLISFEPVSDSVVEGDSVNAGSLLGRVEGASHCGTSCLHIGVRVDGHYVNPLRYFAGGRPQLLPLHQAQALS